MNHPASLHRKNIFYKVQNQTHTFFFVYIFSFACYANGNTWIIMGDEEITNFSGVCYKRRKRKYELDVVNFGEDGEEAFSLSCPKIGQNEKGIHPLLRSMPMPILTQMSTIDEETFSKSSRHFTMRPTKSSSSGTRSNMSSTSGHPSGTSEDIDTMTLCSSRCNILPKMSLSSRDLSKRKKGRKERKEVKRSMSNGDIYNRNIKVYTMHVDIPKPKINKKPLKRSESNVSIVKVKRPSVLSCILSQMFRDAKTGKVKSESKEKKEKIKNRKADAEKIRKLFEEKIGELDEEKIRKLFDLDEERTDCGRSEVASVEGKKSRRLDDQKKIVALEEGKKSDQKKIKKLEEEKKVRKLGELDEGKLDKPRRLDDQKKDEGKRKIKKLEEEKKARKLNPIEEEGAKGGRKLLKSRKRDEAHKSAKEKKVAKDEATVDIETFAKDIQKICKSKKGKYKPAGDATDLPEETNRKPRVDSSHAKDKKRIKPKNDASNSKQNKESKGVAKKRKSFEVLNKIDRDEGKRTTEDDLEEERQNRRRRSKHEEGGGKLKSSKEEKRTRTSESATRGDPKTFKEKTLEAIKEKLNRGRKSRSPEEYSEYEENTATIKGTTSRSSREIVASVQQSQINFMDLQQRSQYSRETLRSSKYTVKSKNTSRSSIGVEERLTRTRSKLKEFERCERRKSVEMKENKGRKSRSPEEKGERYNSVEIKGRKCRSPEDIGRRERYNSVEMKETKRRKSKSPEETGRRERYNSVEMKEFGRHEENKGRKSRSREDIGRRERYNPVEMKETKGRKSRSPEGIGGCNSVETKVNKRRKSRSSEDGRKDAKKGTRRSRSVFSKNHQLRSESKSLERALKKLFERSKSKSLDRLRKQLLGRSKSKNKHERERGKTYSKSLERDAKKSKGRGGSVSSNDSKSSERDTRKINGRGRSVSSNAGSIESLERKMKKSNGRGRSASSNASISRESLEREMKKSTGRGRSASSNARSISRDLVRKLLGESKSNSLERNARSLSRHLVWKLRGGSSERNAITETNSKNSEEELPEETWKVMSRIIQETSRDLNKSQDDVAAKSPMMNKRGRGRSDSTSAGMRNKITEKEKSQATKSPTMSKKSHSTSAGMRNFYSTTEKDLNYKKTRGRSESTSEIMQIKITEKEKKSPTLSKKSRPRSESTSAGVLNFYSTTEKDLNKSQDDLAAKSPALYKKTRGRSESTSAGTQMRITERAAKPPTLNKKSRPRSESTSAGVLEKDFNNIAAKSPKTRRSELTSAGTQMKPTRRVETQRSSKSSVKPPKRPRRQKSKDPANGKKKHKRLRVSKSSEERDLEERRKRSRSGEVAKSKSSDFEENASMKAQKRKRFGKTNRASEEALSVLDTSGDARERNRKRNGEEMKRTAARAQKNFKVEWCSGDEGEDLRANRVFKRKRKFKEDRYRADGVEEATPAGDEDFKKMRKFKEERFRLDGVEEATPADDKDFKKKRKFKEERYRLGDVEGKGYEEATPAADEDLKKMRKFKEERYRATNSFDDVEGEDDDDDDDATPAGDKDFKKTRKFKEERFRLDGVESKGYEEATPAGNKDFKKSRKFKEETFRPTYSFDDVEVEVNDDTARKFKEERFRLDGVEGKGYEEATPAGDKDFKKSRKFKEERCRPTYSFDDVEVEDDADLKKMRKFKEERFRPNVEGKDYEEVTPAGDKDFRQIRKFKEERCRPTYSLDDVEVEDDADLKKMRKFKEERFRLDVEGKDYEEATPAGDRDLKKMRKFKEERFRTTYSFDDVEVEDNDDADLKKIRKFKEERCRLDGVEGKGYEDATPAGDKDFRKMRKFKEERCRPTYSLDDVEVEDDADLKKMRKFKEERFRLNVEGKDYDEATPAGDKDLKKMRKLKEERCRPTYSFRDVEVEDDDDTNLKIIRKFKEERYRLDGVEGKGYEEATPAGDKDFKKMKKFKEERFRFDDVEVEDDDDKDLKKKGKFKEERFRLDGVEGKGYEEATPAHPKSRTFRYRSDEGNESETFQKQDADYYNKKSLSRTAKKYSHKTGTHAGGNEEGNYRDDDATPVGDKDFKKIKKIKEERYRPDFEGKDYDDAAATPAGDLKKKRKFKEERHRPDVEGKDYDEAPKSRIFRYRSDEGNGSDQDDYHQKKCSAKTKSRKYEEDGATFTLMHVDGRRKKEKEDLGHRKNKPKREKENKRLLKIKRSLMQITICGKRMKTKKKQRAKATHENSCNMRRFLDKDHASVWKLCKYEDNPTTTVTRSELGSLDIPSFKPKAKAKKETPSSSLLLRSVNQYPSFIYADVIHTGKFLEEKYSIESIQMILGTRSEQTNQSSIFGSVNQNTWLSSYDSHDSFMSSASATICKNEARSVAILSDLTPINNRDRTFCNFGIRNLMDSLYIKPIFDTSDEPYYTVNSITKQIKTTGTNTEIIWTRDELKLQKFSSHRAMPLFERFEDPDAKIYPKNFEVNAASNFYCEGSSNIVRNNAETHEDHPENCDKKYDFCKCENCEKSYDFCKELPEGGINALPNNFGECPENRPVEESSKSKNVEEKSEEVDPKPPKRKHLRSKAIPKDPERKPSEANIFESKGIDEDPEQKSSEAKIFASKGIDEDPEQKTSKTKIFGIDKDPEQKSSETEIFGSKGIDEDPVQKSSKAKNFGSKEICKDPEQKSSKAKNFGSKEICKDPQQKSSKTEIIGSKAIYKDPEKKSSKANIFESKDPEQKSSKAKIVGSKEIDRTKSEDPSKNCYHRKKTSKIPIHVKAQPSNPKIPKEPTDKPKKIRGKSLIPKRKTRANCCPELIEIHEADSRSDCENRKNPNSSVRRKSRIDCFRKSTNHDREKKTAEYNPKSLFGETITKQIPQSAATPDVRASMAKQVPQSATPDAKASIAKRMFQSAATTDDGASMTKQTLQSATADVKASIAQRKLQSASTTDDGASIAKQMLQSATPDVKSSITKRMLQSAATSDDGTSIIDPKNVRASMEEQTPQNATADDAKDEEETPNVSSLSNSMQDFGRNFNCNVSSIDDEMPELIFSDEETREQKQKKKKKKKDKSGWLIGLFSKNSQDKSKSNLELEKSKIRRDKKIKLKNDEDDMMKITTKASPEGLTMKKVKASRDEDDVMKIITKVSPEGSTMKKVKASKDEDDVMKIITKVSPEGLTIKKIKASKDEDLMMANDERIKSGDYTMTRKKTGKDEELLANDERIKIEDYAIAKKKTAKASKDEDDEKKITKGLTIKKESTDILDENLMEEIEEVNALMKHDEDLIENKTENTILKLLSDRMRSSDEEKINRLKKKHIAFINAKQRHRSKSGLLDSKDKGGRMVSKVTPVLADVESAKEFLVDENIRKIAKSEKSEFFANEKIKKKISLRDSKDKGGRIVCKITPVLTNVESEKEFLVSEKSKKNFSRVESEKELLANERNKKKYSLEKNSVESEREFPVNAKKKTSLEKSRNNFFGKFKRKRDSIEDFTIKIDLASTPAKDMLFFNSKVSRKNSCLDKIRHSESSICLGDTNLAKESESLRSVSFFLPPKPENKGKKSRLPLPLRQSKHPRGARATYTVPIELDLKKLSFRENGNEKEAKLQITLIILDKT